MSPPYGPTGHMMTIRLKADLTASGITHLRTLKILKLGHMAAIPVAFLYTTVSSHITNIPFLQS